MRTGISLMILCATASAGVAQLQLPKFEFRGFIAGETIASDRLLNCKSEQPGELNCIEGYVEVAGASSFVMETIYQSKLSYVGIISNQRNWSKLHEAFTAKYGKPCEQDVKTWQNAAGLSVKNVYEVWCFASGKLELRQYGSKITETMASYIDDNRVPRPAAKVDF